MNFQPPLPLIDRIINKRGVPSQFQVWCHVIDQSLVEVDDHVISSFPLHPDLINFIRFLNNYGFFLKGMNEILFPFAWQICIA